MTIEEKIKECIKREVEKIGRPDLFREPIVGFSSSSDKRYDELKNIIGPWVVHPKEILNTCESVISYFVPFTKDVACAPSKEEYQANIWSEAYNIINRNFPEISLKVVSLLKDEGYDASVIVSVNNTDLGSLKSEWPNKSASVISEIGSFGKNHIVMTKKGSAGRLMTVFTSAKLQVSSKYDGPTCINCNKCVDICPVHSIGENGDINLKDCLDRLNLSDELFLKSSAFETLATCGKCSSVCPFSYIE